MKRIVTILTPGFADWETALLNAVSHSFYGVETHFATPDGKPVTSSGGMKVTPDLGVADIDIGALDALVVCGGTAWTSDNVPDVSAVLQSARQNGVIVAGICDGTRALAKAGLLDGVKHTSNSADNLTAVGYGGAGLYQDVPHAVRDGQVVTAPGTAPVSFMAEVLRGLGLGDDNLDYYLGLHAAEHKAA